MNTHTVSAVLFAAMTSMAPAVAMANPAAAEPAFSDEPPKISSLLTLAANYEKDATDFDNAWRAAVAYCEASRLGSIEAQYRLGQLYASGKGVPADKAMAAALFSQAAHQGHAAARNMLETVGLAASDLPPCVVGETLPEQLPRPKVATVGPSRDSGNFERKLAELPDAKRWIIDLADALAMRYGVDPRLVLAIIAVESNFEVRAQSPKAAQGLMQLIPDTSERFSVSNAFDAAQNIVGGIRYLRWLLSYYRGDISLVAAAYNAGEKAVDRHQGIPPYPETRRYVERVLDLYQRQFHPYEEGLVVTPSPMVSRQR